MMLRGRGGGPGPPRSRPPSYRGGRRGIQPVPVAGSTLHRGPHAVSTGRYASTSRPYSPRLRRGTPYRVRRGRTATSTRAPLWAHVRAQLGPHTGPDPLDRGRRYTTSGRRQSRAPCRLAGSMPYHLGATPPPAGPTRRARIRPGDRPTTCHQALPPVWRQPSSTRCSRRRGYDPGSPHLSATGSYCRSEPDLTEPVSRRPLRRLGPGLRCRCSGPDGHGSPRHVTTSPQRLA